MVFCPPLFSPSFLVIVFKNTMTRKEGGNNGAQNTI
jgi:hypothetical protein